MGGIFGFTALLCHWKGSNREWRSLSLLACHVQDRAVELGLNHGKRLHLRERLKAARLTCPLFDTVTWVKDLEKVLFKMWSIHCEGSGPRCFEVR